MRVFGKDAWIGNDHPFQKLLIGKSRLGQLLRLIRNLPNGMANGHVWRGVPTQ
jgi:hypothetical protein